MQAAQVALLHLQPPLSAVSKRQLPPPLPLHLQALALAQPLPVSPPLVLALPLWLTMDTAMPQLAMAMGPHPLPQLVAILLATHLISLVVVPTLPGSLQAPPCPLGPLEVRTLPFLLGSHQPTPTLLARPGSLLEMAR